MQYPRLGLFIFASRIPLARKDHCRPVPLKIATKVDKTDEAYFREEIAPLLSDPGVEFIGEINERSKTELLGEAQALLFPIDWPEPFGLVMIEAMACVHPCLLSAKAPFSEIIDQGREGGHRRYDKGVVRMRPRVIALDRHAIHRRFEQQFSFPRMAADYVALYRSLLERSSRSVRATLVPLPVSEKS